VRGKRIVYATVLASVGMVVSAGQLLFYGFACHREMQHSSVNDGVFVLKTAHAKYNNLI
jgi:hypothetical protein